MPSRRTYLVSSERCQARSIRSGERCRSRAILGGSVCFMHGGGAPQVKAAAARRLTLAEALESGPRRHPLEVLADALHVADTVAGELRAAIVRGERLTPEMVQVLLDSVKTQAQMARLVIGEGAGPDDWSAQEALRRQGAVLAEIVQEFARELGLDPSSTAVAEAFRVAKDRVVFRVKPRRVKARVAIEGGGSG